MYILPQLKAVFFFNEKIAISPLAQKEAPQGLTSAGY